MTHELDCSLFLQKNSTMSLKCFQQCFSRAKRTEIGNLRKTIFDETSTDTEKRDNKYLTALHLAARHGQADCVEELLKRGADPNKQSPLGTAMHLAAAKGHLRCLELLTEHGGLLLARDKRGETVLQLAERMNQEDVIHYIARHSSLHPHQIKDSPKTDSIDLYGEFFPERKEKSDNKKVQEKDQTKNSDDDKCDINEASTVINVPIPEICPEELDLNENCKYAIGPKTLSIMGKLNGRIVTVKKYQQTIPDCEISQLLNNEYETIRCLYHPNIALVIAICYGSKTLEQFLVFEPLEYHFLHRLLFEEKVRLEEDPILKIAHDVANAMQYFHNMGFLHCYLGAHSVIVTRDYTAKICNFEYSLREDKGPVSLSHCTLLHNWMSPEQILGFPVDRSGDVFSFGILMWECLVLKRSRQMFSLQKLAVIGKSVHYKLISKVEGKKNVKLVISDCTKIASKRPTFHQIFAWLDGLLHYRLVNVAPVTMDEELQAPNLFA